MEVNLDLIKHSLHNIRLLSLDFKEQVNNEELEELKKIERRKRKSEYIDPYENGFYNEVLNTQITMFNQIYFFTRQILHELARDREENDDDLDIDKEKAKLVLKSLDKKEIELIKVIYDFEFKAGRLDPDFEDMKFLNKLKKVFPRMERLMDTAIDIPSA